MSNVTPMMKQYLNIKKDYEDAFLFFRLGDFYEMFFEDAIKASQELEITLTKRDAKKENAIPMCGVPYHAAEGYIKTLVDRGYKVAICEQVEDPKTAKGVVKREVIQLITPGTVMDGAMLKEKENNYIASLSFFEPDHFIIVYHELSTGETNLVEVDHITSVLHELSNQQVKELVVSKKFPEHLLTALTSRLDVTLSFEDETTFLGEFRYLYETLEDDKLMAAFSRLLNYIQHSQKRSINHFQIPKVIELDHYLSLDMYAKRNLELTETLMKKTKHGSLLWVLDKTVTAMGGRTLKKWIERPLQNEALINQRLNIVEQFTENFLTRETIRESLKTVYDLERLAGRISFGNVNARDLIQLKHSLQSIPHLKDALEQFDSDDIKEINAAIQVPSHLLDLLTSSLIDEPPISITEGNMIKDGFNDQLDQYRLALRDGKQWILDLESKEREKTGIKSLKVGFNKVFGYYIEIRHTHKDKVPEERYERKQTLTNAERFITPELKEKEKIILEAEEKSVDLEYELFIQIRDQIKDDIKAIQHLAHLISQIDVLQSFSQVSEENNYIRPSFNHSKINIKEGRHPVVERVMKESQYVPNDVYLDQEKFILLITGPNMSGKSTYMRQLALTVIMGQIGCFVPATKAELKIVDQIFTRIGAADDLVSGQSTFMVEMLEANHALENATKDSLIIFDEIGRGTSTYDGMALANAIIEYIHHSLGAMTMFSTHYHELTDLDQSLAHLKNISVRAEEYENEIIFLHKIEEGKANESYGIHVAKLANMPDTLIERAQNILSTLEAAATKPKASDMQLSFFEAESKPVYTKTKHPKKDIEILETIQTIEIHDMTPMDAMNLLHDLHKKSK